MVWTDCVCQVKILDSVTIVYRYTCIHVYSLNINNALHDHARRRRGSEACRRAHRPTKNAEPRRSHTAAADGATVTQDAETPTEAQQSHRGCPPQPGQNTEPEQCRRRGVYLYKYGMAAEPQSRNPCVFNGLRVHQKKFEKIKKSVDMWGHMVYIYFRWMWGHTPRSRAAESGTEAPTEGRKDRTP